MQAESGEQGEVRKILDICFKSGSILYSWISGLGTTTTLWSPDSNYLAVNDTPGERGGLVHHFVLDSKKTASFVCANQMEKKCSSQAPTDGPCLNSPTLSF